MTCHLDDEIAGAHYEICLTVPTEELSCLAQMRVSWNRPFAYVTWLAPAKVCTSFDPFGSSYSGWLTPSAGVWPLSLVFSESCWHVRREAEGCAVPAAVSLLLLQQYSEGRPYLPALSPAVQCNLMCCPVLSIGHFLSKSLHSAHYEGIIQVTQSHLNCYNEAGIHFLSFKL